MTPMNPNTTHRLVYTTIFLGERASPTPTGEVQFVIDPIHGSVDVRASCDWTQVLEVWVGEEKYSFTSGGKWMPKETAREVWKALVNLGWKVPE